MEVLDFDGNILGFDVLKKTKKCRRDQWLPSKSSRA